MPDGLAWMHSSDMAGMDRTAAMSPDLAYRYYLEWRWAEGPPLLAWMLNPSTADHTITDPTLDCLMKRAARWHLGAVRIINLFAFRATEPANMKLGVDPVGPLNDQVTVSLLAEQEQFGERTLCGWGKHGRFAGREAAALALAGACRARLDVLALNIDGTPRHPLYIPLDTPRDPWNPGG